MRRTRISLVACSSLLFLAASVLHPSAGVGAQARGQGAPPAPPFPFGAARGAAPPETGTAGLAGRILAADTGAPLRRAQVTLTATEGRLRRATFTDAEGAYAFTDLPAGRYTISATKAGYVTLQYGQRRAFEPGRAVTLADGRQVAAVNLPLPRGAVIVVRVTDDRGEPLPGAMVQVQRYQYGPDGQPRLTGASAATTLATTDDRGDFRAYGLMPGEYVLSARASPVTMTRSAPGTASGQDEGLATTFYPGTISAAEAQPVSVGLGEETFVQLSLVAARFARVSGTVETSGGQPAAGASISLATYSGSSMSSSSAGTVADDGSFSLAGVPPGEHYLQVRQGSTLSLFSATAAGGSNVIAVQGVAQPGPSAAAGNETASVPITAAGRDITGLRIVTGPGTEVTGIVVYQGDPPARSAQGPRVSLRPVGPLGTFGGASAGPAGDDGGFTITGGSGRVLFNVVGPDGWSLLSVTLDGRDVTDEPIDLAGVPSLSGVVVTIASDLPHLRGTVAGPGGEPARDYAVVLQPAEALEPDAAARRVHVLRPDAQGTFESPGLRPGRYVATAIEGLDDGRQYSPAFRDQLRPRGREIQVERRGDVTLDLVLVSGL
jgi:protocatechuate 3,4-dioxygenase beta subunit